MQLEVTHDELFYLMNGMKIYIKEAQNIINNQFIPFPSEYEMQLMYERIKQVDKLKELERKITKLYMKSLKDE